MAGLIHFQNPDLINQTPVSAASPLPTMSGGGSTATVTSAAASITSGVAHVANASRLGIVFNNTGTAGTVYLLMGSGTASATNYTAAIAPGASYVPPANFTGAYQAVWSTVTGAGPLVVTELTA